ncbi:tRNA adenosine deaminase-associated protein [Streptomyces sp. NPDC090054]|uniref:tRNA adenosine deaminase-associated protein n=1 Tax=Streptomyces sp. NPDC090054 TaxID=3365933 RepID=UPI00381BCB9B
MTEHKNHRYAITVERRGGAWHCTRLDPTALTGIDEAIAAVRAIGSSEAVFGFFNADESLFLILRSAPPGIALLLSDARAAHRHTLAAQALDVLHIALPKRTHPAHTRPEIRASSPTWGSLPRPWTPSWPDRTAGPTANCVPSRTGADSTPSSTACAGRAPVAAASGRKERPAGSR